MKAKQKSAKNNAPAEKRYQGFSDDERAAMRAAVREQRTNQVDPAGEVQQKIAEMTDSDRAMAERVHAIMTGTKVGLSPRTWYGMPAYAKDGNTICFFKPAKKFKTRYATLGFSDKAKLDDGEMWPTEYALMKLGAGEEKRIVELMTRAVG